MLIGPDCRGPLVAHIPAEDVLEAGGKPSTWLPPGGLVEHHSFAVVRFWWPRMQSYALADARSGWEVKNSAILKVTTKWTYKSSPWSTTARPRLLQMDISSCMNCFDTNIYLGKLSRAQTNGQTFQHQPNWWFKPSICHLTGFLQLAQHCCGIAWSRR